MKNLNKILLGISVLTVGAVNAQMSPNDSSSEVITKTFHFYKDGKLIENSVKITTNATQEVRLEEEDSKKVDQARIPSQKMVRKIIEIDNDEDANYDEKIVFRYSSNTEDDFVLVSNKEEVMVAVENGKDLELVHHENMPIADLNNHKNAYVITDNNGKEVELFVESYETME